MQCYISPNLFILRNTFIYILDGLRVSTFHQMFILGRTIPLKPEAQNCAFFVTPHCYLCVKTDCRWKKFSFNGKIWTIFTLLKTVILQLWAAQCLQTFAQLKVVVDLYFKADDSVNSNQTFHGKDVLTLSEIIVFILPNIFQMIFYGNRGWRLISAFSLFVDCMHYLIALICPGRASSGQ